MRTSMFPGDGDARHGTVNGYVNLLCSCAHCRAAWAAEIRQQRTRRAGTLAADDPRHGTDNGYTNYYCRCAECTTVHRQSNLSRKPS